jgi:hypothetical protein
MNLDRNNDQQGNFDINVTQNGSNLFGIKSARTYDVRNIAAYTGFDSNRRNAFLNRKTGSQLFSGGLFVGVKKVPTSDAGWTTVPFEAQYLKLYDVTMPTTIPGTATPPNMYLYGLGNSVNVTWTAASPDTEGVTPCYRVTVVNGNPNGLVICSTSTTLSGTVGQTLHVVIETVNPSDNTVIGPSSSVDIKLIDPNGDDDGDGMTNGAEDVAGTNPFDANSKFRITSITRSNQNTVSVTWSSVPGKAYKVDSTGSLTAAFSPLTGTIVANGPETEPMFGGIITRTANTITFSYSAGETVKFYRVELP